MMNGRDLLRWLTAQIERYHAGTGILVRSRTKDASDATCKAVSEALMKCVNDHRPGIDFRSSLVVMLDAMIDG